MKRLVSLLCVLCLLFGAALADEDLSGYNIANGQVAAVKYEYLTAPCSGTLQPFDAAAGDEVSAGDVLFSMVITEVTAPEDGTVVWVYADDGDSAEEVQAVYGALLAIEPASAYRITATTGTAYNKEENKIIHVGETLYFQSNKSGKEEGSGRVIAVSGATYQVEILEGSFDKGEGLALYRNSDYDGDQKVGAGTVTRRDPVMIQAAGRIGQMLVSAGDEVKKGDTLLTILGTDADRGASADVVASKDGVITSVAVQPGQQVWKGEVLARVDFTDKWEVIAEVDETDLSAIEVGSTVPVTLDMDESRVLHGEVTEISAVGTTRQNAAYYQVHVSVSSEDMLIGASASVYIPKE